MLSTTELDVAEPELRQGALVEEAAAEPFEVMVAPATLESQLVCTLASKRHASESKGVHCRRGRLGFARTRGGRLMLPSHQTKRF